MKKNKTANQETKQENIETTKQQQNPKKQNSIWRVFGTYSEFKWRMVAVIVLGIIGIVLYSMMPTYFESALDKLEKSIPNPIFADIYKILAIYLSLAVINEVFAIICIFLILNYEGKIIQKVNVMVKHKLDVVPTSFLQRYNTGDLTRIVAYNVPDMMKNVLLNIYKISRAVFFYITTSISMFAINDVLALVVISSLPLCILAARFVSKRTQKYFNDQNELSGVLTTYIDQKISLHGFYKMHGLDGETAEFNQKNNDHAKSLVGEVTATSLNTTYITFISNFMNVLVTTLCCVFYIKGGIGFAALPAFLMFSQRFLSNATVVTDATNMLQTMGARAERVFAILDSPDDVTEKEHIEIKKLKGQIEFKNVTLIEDNETVIDNISFKIPQGSSVGIVGSTGAGKHKVVELISKLALANSGSITIDGINLDEIKSSCYYDRMGIAFERPFIFKGSVAENIVYGIGRALPENVMKITKKLGSHHFIEQLPNKYETELCENTSLLSISQKQALNVARTVLQAPDLVVIDNALSNADNKIEKQVFEEIIKLDKNQTKIFVTSRLGSIQSCDLILFMEKGRVAEIGTHEQLMAKKKKYFKVFSGN